MFTTTTSSSRRGLRDLLLSVVGISLLALLSGCGAVHTSIAKANLEVSTKMSDAVFLDPVAQKTNAPSSSRSAIPRTSRALPLNRP